MTAKKASTRGGDRSDPKSNKSLAIRLTLQKSPKKTPASQIAAAVKKEYGHEVSQNMIYMVKTKLNMRKGKGGKAGRAAAPSGSQEWIGAIRSARELLKSAGGVDNAVALLRALDRE